MISEISSVAIIGCGNVGSACAASLIEMLSWLGYQFQESSGTLKSFAQPADCFPGDMAAKDRQKPL